MCVLVENVKDLFHQGLPDRAEPTTDCTQELFIPNPAIMVSIKGREDGVELVIRQSKGIDPAALLKLAGIQCSVAIAVHNLRLDCGGASPYVRSRNAAGFHRLDAGNRVRVYGSELGMEAEKALEAKHGCLLQAVRDCGWQSVP